MPNNANSHHDQNPAPTIRAYLGGSFDPVHNGHLQMVMSVYKHLLPIAKQQQCEMQVSLLPNARSPFKDHSTNPEHRLAMLKLATKDTPLQISELELWQNPPVYSIDSVQTLRTRYPDDSLIFIMGIDSARTLAKWKDGLQLTDYVHLWVFSRTEYSDLSTARTIPKTVPEKTSKKLPDLMTHKQDSDRTLSKQDIANLRSELPMQLQAQVTESALDLLPPFSYSAQNLIPLKSSAQGRIYIDQRQVNAISSTDIRKQLQMHPTTADIEPNNAGKLLNPAVYQYIIAHQLYSATQFR